MNRIFKQEEKFDGVKNYIFVNQSIIQLCRCDFGVIGTEV